MSVEYHLNKLETDHKYRLNNRTRCYDDKIELNKWLERARINIYEEEALWDNYTNPK